MADLPQFTIVVPGLDAAKPDSQPSSPSPSRPTPPLPKRTTKQTLRPADEG